MLGLLVERGIHDELRGEAYPVINAVDCRLPSSELQRLHRFRATRPKADY